MLIRPSNELRREVLSLYREVLRTCNAFYWANEAGEPWSKVLKASARKEFENNRFLVDEVEIKRQLVIGNQCVDEIRRKFNHTEKEIRERVERTKLR